MDTAMIEESDITYMSELTPPHSCRMQEAGLIRTYHLRRTTCSVSDVLI